jgi:single-stranded DNA-binding protein
LELARALSSLSCPSPAGAGCVNSTTNSQEDALMVTLTGNGGLTKDPELRHTSSGKAIATVSVACRRRDRDADPVYVELVLWDKQAELAAQHLVKGPAGRVLGAAGPAAVDGPRR